MQKLEPRIFSLMAMVAAVFLLATAGGALAQSGNAPVDQAEQQPAQAPADQGDSQTRNGEPSPDESRAAAPKRRSVPHVTGTVARWTGNRIDLKKTDGTLQKVAVNPGTERLVEIREGAEVTVEYRRKISGFVIAERVLAADAGAAAAPPGKGAAAGRKAASVTGEVVSWNDAALLLRTDAGEITFFLSPSTEYLVKSLDPGLQVTVEYRESSDRSKLATRVLAAKAKGEASAKKDGGSE